MKILLTGANGYIGKRLLGMLVALGHEVVCCVRDKNRFPTEGIYANSKVSVFEIDFLETGQNISSLREMDAAYYLIHSMSDDTASFEALEARSARNFVSLVQQTKIKQIIYLGGITNEKVLSKHLASRKMVEDILRTSGIPITSLKAGIIVGSGSSSFEIIRDLVEKLPVMVTPKWLDTKTQPIAIRDVMHFLIGVLGREESLGQAYDIGGPDVLTYKEMLLQFAAVRGLKRWIYTVPIMTPKLSSYWLYFVTSTSYKLAVNLVHSMKIEVIASPNDLAEMLGIKPIAYKKAVELAFQRIEENDVISSWKDSMVSSNGPNDLLAHIQVPTNGCFIDDRLRRITSDKGQVVRNIWSIGGNRGWYYADWLWRLRGFMDKFVGGVGLRRGRTNEGKIRTGDTLDFWRVLAADQAHDRLLLYAEMKLPGEAWLELKVIDVKGVPHLQQTATFRPKGLFGRAYWYAVKPLHYFIFEGMARNLMRFVDPNLTHASVRGAAGNTVTVYPIGDD